MYKDKREFQKSETCFINAKKPELAVRMYTECGAFNDAMRIAKKHAPALLQDVQKLMERTNQNKG
jgi:hypothetical protein